MTEEKLNLLNEGLTTAYIDGAAAAMPAYKPMFLSNNPGEGKKVLAEIEEELAKCDKFQISVAFITDNGIEPLMQTLKELEEKNIPGEILTTNYLNFSEPKALKRLAERKNITLKMYDVNKSREGFHTKGYIFRRDELYRIIIGSSNITSTALTTNKEWNTKIISTEQGEIAGEIVREFTEFWNSEYAVPYEEFIDRYKEEYEIIKKQRKIAESGNVTSLIKYTLKPNSMQLGFIANLRKIVDKNESRALLISATGTGKTYASAFAIRELGYKKVLFLVHRAALARQAMASFKNVFDNSKSMGLVGDGKAEYDADFIFAMVETLHKEENLKKFSPNEFDCIVLDEAHHSPANTYQKVMEYFTPKLFLGMTATPDKREDGDISKNVYELFNYQIAYEIRLQQAMEEDLLCPFHYFGISDISLLTDEQVMAKKITEEDFNMLTSDERVKHVIEQAEYYGYSGDRVKGLIFCSRNKECNELSEKFNKLGYRTVALSGANSEKERAEAFERLAMNEEDATSDKQPLDYIFSVDILNEGIDIVEVNQVIMLRPTQSPIVFIQQLGRGLRKAEGKEFVVILDFIGNYNNNFMIPVALSGDRTYNPDTIRKYVISGNNTIPGASTVHFDEVAKDKIFHSIDKIKGIKAIIKESYVSLKNRLGRRPLLYDFYKQGEIDPLVIIKEYKTYWQFMTSVEKDNYNCMLTSHEKLILEYLSKTILSGVRPNELVILQELLDKDFILPSDIQKELLERFSYKITDTEISESARVLQGFFTSKDEEYQKFKDIDIIKNEEDGEIKRLNGFFLCLQHAEFSEQIKDIINVGLARYKDKYSTGRYSETPFVLYEKYSRRDVSLLTNCGKDLSSTMYGMSRINDDLFIFITYHKEEAEEGKNYVEGKPDYADAFEDNQIFRWDSQIGKNNSSPYMKKVIEAPRKHLLVKKSDAETSFYYMGQFDIVESVDSTKEDNNGKLKPIAKVKMKMRQPVREDLLRYLQSNILKETV
jgi:superfamily II DNA or RNA helicase